MNCPACGCTRVGPKGARYQDVTLDLRRGDDPAKPSGASVLFLENGGGKTVLVRLIFSVILPGRRQVVGTSNSRVLEKFVLAGDVAHVALEWRDTRTGELLVTGKVSEWRGHVVSTDSDRLIEQWYTFRPTATLDLSTLPFTQDGRIVTLAGFRDRLYERTGGRLGAAGQLGRQARRLDGAPRQLAARPRAVQLPAKDERGRGRGRRRLQVQDRRGVHGRAIDPTPSRMRSRRASVTWWPGTPPSSASRG